MAAYAALLSFMNTTEQIMNHPRLSTSLDDKLIESLREKVGFLQDFLEIYSHSRETEFLERQIASVVHAAEDVLEFQVVDQILAASVEEWESSTFLFDLKKVIEEMDSVMEEVMKIKEERGSKDLWPTVVSSRPLTAGNNTMIGFDEELIRLMDELTGQPYSRRIIPIVGMAGIGKTTLARNAYENLLIVQHFDIRCWVTISQEYEVKRILLDLLSCLKEDIIDKDLKREDQFGDVLYKSLYSRRYLIVLDDVWSVEVWDKIKRFFPDSEDGSRVVITTRQSNMARYYDSSSLT